MGIVDVANRLKQVKVDIIEHEEWIRKESDSRNRAALEKNLARLKEEHAELMKQLRES